QPPRSQGVLYERYRVEIAGKAPQIITRWYDYAPPHRLAVELRDEGQDAVNYAIRTTGRDIVEYQIRRFDDDSGQPTRINYQLSPGEDAAAIPVLRSALMPIHAFQDAAYQPEINSLYLAQARENGATLLGRSSVAGRTALLLGYTTAQLPLEQQAGELRQVLLAVDSELRALLEVTVLSTGTGESVATRPWRVEQIELLAQAEEGQFSFGAGSSVQVVTGPRSVLAPSIPALFTSLGEAQRESRSGLLLPTAPPTDARGLVLNLRGERASSRYGLIYEGEFQSLLLLPAPGFESNDIRWQGQERSTGPFRYRIAEALDRLEGGLFAQVYHQDTPERRVNIMLWDTLSTAGEREQRLIDVVASLQPVTAENVEALQRDLVSLPSAGGAP
ncbi:MAG: hypothetical protein H7Z42_23230, partial [Roseiflexaceae bacterium]|nr:hypothetical protein [Roseiflexaceae bacterium]